MVEDTVTDVLRGLIDLGYFGNITEAWLGFIDYMSQRTKSVPAAVVDPIHGKERLIWLNALMAKPWSEASEDESFQKWESGKDAVKEAKRFVEFKRTPQV